MSLIRTPNAGKVGTTIGLLGDFKGLTGVEFNGVSATFSGQSLTYREAVVPAGAATGLVTVTTDKGKVTSKEAFFALPSVSRINPLKGRPGDSVILSGTSLTQTNRVVFNRNKPAKFAVSSDSRVIINPALFSRTPNRLEATLCVPCAVR